MGNYKKRKMFQIIDLAGTVFISEVQTNTPRLKIASTSDICQNEASGLR